MSYGYQSTGRRFCMPGCAATLEIGEMFHELARQRECQIEEGHLMSDHVYMLISIPPKYSVSQVVGYIKPRICIRLYVICTDHRYRWREV